MALEMVVTSAFDLIVDPDRRRHAAMPEMDAVTEAGALQEAALVAVRSDPIEASVALLFDLRGALHYMDGNVAILVVRGVTRLDWASGQVTVQPWWWAVMDSVPDPTDGRFSFRLAFVPPDARLQVEGTSAEFYVGNMPGMDDPPPDFTEAGWDEIRAGMPSWATTFEPVAAVFLDPPT